MLDMEVKIHRVGDGGIGATFGVFTRQAQTPNSFHLFIISDTSTQCVCCSSLAILSSCLFADCSAALEANSRHRGVFLMRPDRSERSVRSFCERDATGMTWTVIQRRLDGTLSFARGWDDYKAGFGQPDGEFWIGNDNLHYLTTQDNYVLHLDMWDLENTHHVAKYDFFKVDEESTNYRLHIDGFTGNSTDALRYSNFMPFSTMDRDNDVSSTHCAKFYTAGWWYKHCHYCNLNGRYTVGVVWFNHNIDEWVQMRKTVMKIRLNTHGQAVGSGGG